MRSILEKILVFLAKGVLKRYRPKIIVITGSVGKTSAKEAAFAVLSSKFRTRRNIKNYNTEIGVPLTILEIEWAAGRNIFKWFFGILRAIELILIKSKKYPEILILELGADRPGDIEKFMKYIKPDISIVTAIGEIPVHVEFFAGPLAVAKEKSKVVSALNAEGFAVLNYDDETVLEMKEKTEAHFITYGFQEGADVRATNYELASETINNSTIPKGLIFRLEYKGSFVPVHLNNVFGKPHVYAALVAIAAGLALDLNQVEISRALLNYQSPEGRMRLIKGLKNSYILDDTYNASPLSMLAALQVLEELSAKRKIVVLGDMRELGKYSEEAHRRIGEEAAKISDVIITVGDKARFISADAIEEGFPKERVFEFDTSEEAGKKLYDFLEEGDLILIKGSRVMEMEKAMEQILI